MANCYVIYCLLFMFRLSSITTSTKEIVDSKLHINITEKHLYGHYVCKAFNIFGAAEVTINLYGNYCFLL